jgi:hypothetical protein
VFDFVQRSGPLFVRGFLDQNHIRLSAALFNRDLKAKEAQRHPLSKLGSEGGYADEIGTNLVGLRLDLPELHLAGLHFAKPFVWFNKTAKSSSQRWRP